MQLEQVKPNKPSFPWVVFCFCVAILIIFVAAVIGVRSHYHKRQATPYTSHPVSQLIQGSGAALNA